MKEERCTHTRKPLRGRRLRVAEGGKLRSHGGGKLQGHGGQSGEIPAQRLGAEQHSLAQEACLLPCRGGRGWELRLGLRSDRRERTGVGGVNTA